jgi:hypothetical protein
MVPPINGRTLGRRYFYVMGIRNISSEGKAVAIGPRGWEGGEVKRDIRSM